MYRRFESGYPVIDKIIEIKKGRYARALKSVSLSEDFFTEHFPRFPVVPGVLQLEGMTQLGSLLISVSNDFSYFPMIQTIDDIKFRRFVKPGDILVFEAEILSLNADFAILKANAKVDKIIVAAVRQIKYEYLPLTEEQRSREKNRFSYLENFYE